MDTRATPNFGRVKTVRKSLARLPLLDGNRAKKTDIERLIASLPLADNEAGALDKLLKANAVLRESPWPFAFRNTSHQIFLGDARRLDGVADESVHLVVTSPPYWTLKKYNDHSSQLGAIDDYDSFLDELDEVWKECYRVLVPGGRVCCVVGDVCVPRRKTGRHFVMPLHSDIQVRVRSIGFDNLTPILWYKIANGVTEVEGNGAGFYGKPYQPGAIVKNDVEHILFFRKGGTYRSATALMKALSMLTRDECHSWFRALWSDVPGASTRQHPAPFPVEVAKRLIRMFSFAGDTILDPFLGTGTTVEAAMDTGRNSIGVEIDPTYLKLAENRLTKEASRTRSTCATNIELKVRR